MDSITVDQQLRPTRYAFLVDEGDLDAALKAVSVNSVLWGGILNPIIPMTPEADRGGLLTAFDPDALVVLSGAPLPDHVSEYRYRQLAADDLVAQDPRSGRRRINLGFDVLPLLNHVYEREVRFSPEQSRAALAIPEAIDGWPEFVAFSFGSFRWLPEIDVDYEEAFTRALHAKPVELPALEAPHVDLESMFPPEFTAYDLTLYGGFANFSSHVIFIGNHHNSGDLIEFWNLRATGRRVVFVPAAAFRNFESPIRALANAASYQINQRVQNRADLQKSQSIDDETFATVCDWIASLGLGQLPRRTWPARYGLKGEGYVGDIESAHAVAREERELALLQGAMLTPVKLVAPPFDGEGIGSRAWSVELSFMGGYSTNEFMFAFPREPEVEALIERKMGVLSGDARLGRRGVVLHENSVPSVAYLGPVRTEDVFDCLFRQGGLRATPSVPGRFTEQIIKRMGSVRFDCRVFKVRGIREVLDRLGDGSTLTKGNIYQIVMSKDEDTWGRNWRPELYEDLTLGHRRASGFDFTSIFDYLLEKRLLRPGFVLQCTTCSKDDWYHVSEFSENYVCRFCFTRQRVAFGAKHEWQYKADGMFQIPDSAQGSVSVLLSLWRFESLVHGHRGYVTSQDLLDEETGRSCEIDYAYVIVDNFDSSYELVIGQATRFGDFSDTDAANMTHLADRFDKRPYLAFSTLRDRFSEEDKRRLRNVAEQGYRLIALTREELDRLHLVERFRRTPSGSTSALAALSLSSIQLNLE